MYEAVKLKKFESLVHTTGFLGKKAAGRAFCSENYACVWFLTEETAGNLNEKNREPALYFLVGILCSVFLPRNQSVCMLTCLHGNLRMLDETSTHAQ